jgi:hypothetical protein
MRANPLLASLIVPDTPALPNLSHESGTTAVGVKRRSCCGFSSRHPDQSKLVEGLVAGLVEGAVA